MAHNNPTQSEAFKRQQAPKNGDKALGETICIRLVAEVDEALRAMDGKQQYIREAVFENLIVDGLIKGNL